MQVDLKSKSEMFLEELLQSIGEGEAYNRVVRDMEQYDKKSFDSIDRPCIVSVSNYGSTMITSAGRYCNDLYNAKIWHPGSNDYTHYAYTVQAPRFTYCTLVEAQDYLYNEAKNLGQTPIAPFNNIEGYIVTWEDFLGSIPEAWRPQVEAKEWSNETGYYIQPMKIKLKELYDYEVSCLMSYCRCQVKRVQVKEANTEVTEWIDCKVSKVGVSFERFNPIRENEIQTTAFFQASDMTPDYNPEPRFNWHMQNSSRWLYSGAIALNMYDGKLTFSSHH
jgi:hypothetical protein